MEMNQHNYIYHRWSKQIWLIVQEVYFFWKQKWPLHPTPSGLKGE